jgi:hypothetical protein
LKCIQPATASALAAMKATARNALDFMKVE